MNAPILLFWALLIWSLARGGSMLLNLLFISIAFGTLAVIPPGWTGGVTVLPDAVCALAFTARLALSARARRWMLDAALRWHKLGLLSLFMLVALFGAVFLPALFAGTPVIPFRPAGAVVLTSPLRPTAANITQTAYLLLSALSVLAFAYATTRAEFGRQFLRAIAYGGLALVATGLADMIAQKTGLAPLLAPLRNATYSLNTDDTILGVQRVVGLMPEASAFGPLCVSFGALIMVLRPYYANRKQRAGALVLVLALLLLGWLSTSSTAILCLAGCGLVYALDWCGRLLRRGAPGRGSLNAELYAAMALLVILLLFAMFDSGVFQTDLALLDQLVFNKTASSSYLVRSQWNHVAWQAMLDTYGAGVGVGGTRSSNGIVAVVGSTGVLGGAIYMLFILQTYLRPAGKAAWERGMISALKLGLIVPLLSNVLTSSSADFGLLAASMIGGITGLSLGATASARARLAADLGRFERPGPQGAVL